MTASEFVALLDCGKRAGNGWVARCPSHDDNHASLSVGTGSDGRVLIKCHAGCDNAAIVGAVGVSLKDLFPEDEPRDSTEITYDYRDEDGNLLFQVVRGAGKKFRQRRPGKRGWEYKLGDVRRVPYRLGEILSSRDGGKGVLIVEGEKDADRLAAIGFVATCNAGGAGKWRDEYSDFLKGRDVAILPDNDHPGRDHAKSVAASLAGKARKVWIVELPGLPEKGDVSDWLDMGKSAADIRAEIGRQKNARQEIPAAAFVSSAVRAAGVPAEVAERAKSSHPFHVGFLDDIAIGILDTDLIVLGAPTGAGKTTLATIFAQNAAENGARVHYFALEAHAGEIEQRMLFRIMSRMAWDRKVGEPWQRHAFTYAHWCHGKCADIVFHVESDALAELERKVQSLWTYYRTGEFRVEDLVEQMMAVRKETDLIVLDHLHFIDADDGDEVRAMRKTVKSVSDAIQDARVPVVAIAHLRKMDTRSKRLIPHIADFHGSSDITKIATKVVTLAPSHEEREAPYIAPTFFHVSKDRLAGEQNYTAVVQFDTRKSRYFPGYKLGRLVGGGETWEEVPRGQIPWWAENELRSVAYRGKR